MLTILTVSIWFKPVTSDLTFEQHRDLCVGLIKKFTHYENDTNDFQKCYNNAPSLEKIVEHINRCQELIEMRQDQINQYQSQIENYNSYNQSQIKNIVELYQAKNFVEKHQDQVKEYQSQIEVYQSQIKECKNNIQQNDIYIIYYNGQIKEYKNNINQDDYHKYFNIWIPQLGANSEFYDKSNKKARIIEKIRNKYTTFLKNCQNKSEKSVMLNPATSFCEANIESQNSTFLKDLINGQRVITH